jgi:hypothetical protein
MTYVQYMILPLQQLSPHGRFSCFLSTVPLSYSARSISQTRITDHHHPCTPCGWNGHLRHDNDEPMLTVL